jgi:hypothetical protein
LCCLFFFDIRILINPLVSSISSYISSIPSIVGSNSTSKWICYGTKQNP